jgi:hypothetical protein
MLAWASCVTNHALFNFQVIASTGSDHSRPGPLFNNAQGPEEPLAYTLRSLNLLASHAACLLLSDTTHTPGPSLPQSPVSAAALPAMVHTGPCQLLPCSAAPS